MKNPLEWEREFIEKLADQPSGRKAWVKLEAAWLGDFAKYLLYQGYAFGDSVPAEVSGGLGNANSRVSPLKRAKRIAQERQDDPRTQLFRARLDAATENIGDAEWPFQNPHVKTFADAAKAYPEIGSLPVEKAKQAIGDGRQSIERYGRKQLLVVLRAGAKARDVPLTLTELAELAYAANEDADPLDKNTLQRFFRLRDVGRTEAAFQRHFEASEIWDLLSICEAVKQELAGIQRDPNGLENSP